MDGPLRICLVASSRHPVREPFAGGLEAQTHQLARALTARGHRVSLFAGPGSDPALDVTELPVAELEVSELASADVNAPPARWMAEHHAYLALMLDLAGPRAHEFDLVHDNSLHHLPVAMASTVPAPVVSTLHTPPLPWLESAVALASPGSCHFTAVSEFCLEQWSPRVSGTVVRNGVDVDRWRPGFGGGPAVWSGRITAEKAPHLAILACRAAGIRLRLVGPVSDPVYYASHVAPLLGPDAEHVGHLAHDRLAGLVGEATVALVTPAWDEPYGLVAAEAMACGTPVAGFAAGALPEVVGADGGVLVTPGDVPALAQAVRRAARHDRRAVRAAAVRDCSLDAMVAGYERVYRDVVRRPREPSRTRDTAA